MIRLYLTATAAKAAADAAQAALMAIDAGDAELAADVSMGK